MSKTIQVFITLSMIGFLSIGCNQATEKAVEQTTEVSEPTQEQTPEVQAEASTELPASDEATAEGGAFPFNLEAATLLASADKFDGAEDKVVANCGGCALAMPGSSEHALQVGDYSLQFCSTTCKALFETDTETAVMAMTIPSTEAE